MKLVKKQRKGKMAASLVPLVTLLIVWGLAQTNMYHRLEAWMDDGLQYRAANEVYFDDIVFLDIDDVTIQKLMPAHGVWPYKRDIYGVVLDYLNNAGADRVVFDILFAEPREGDEVLADALSRYNNAVFVASSPVLGSDDTLTHEDYRQRIAKNSWVVSPHFPAVNTQALILPVSSLSQADSDLNNVGIVDVTTDVDGVVRSMPLVHKIGNSYMPSLPLAVHQLGSDQYNVKYHKFDNQIVVGGQTWPVDSAGRLKVYYPKNANSVLSLSFYKVVDAAKGLTQPEGAESFFKGKTVFIGSTAFKSDKVNTPRGMMSGTYLLSIAYQNLKHNLAMKPDNAIWNLLLVIFSMLPAIVAAIYRRYVAWMYASAVLATATGLVAFNWYMLLLFNQSSALLLPLLVLFIAHVLHVLVFSFLMQKQNLHLKNFGKELIDINEQLEAIANTDELTGLLNRRAFMHLFNHEMDRFCRQDTVFTVVIMDLDKFKKVNDDYGHQAGDDVLKMFSSVLQSTLRKSDISARWGGEEFVAILPDTHEAQAKEALDKLRMQLKEQAVETEKGPLKVTVSAGAAEMDDPDLTLDDILARADKALYMAKETGRDRVCLYKSNSH